MHKMIDCENLESAIRSVCDLFSCSAADLRLQLKQIEIDRIYREGGPDYPPDEFLYRELISSFGKPVYPKSICWFHLTRTYPGNDFNEGILPLGMALESIWDMIFRAFELTEHYDRLLSMKTQGVGNELYQLKVPDPFHWGPFAMLVKDVAFRAHRIGNHDYLKLPEIVEDICNCYLKKFGVSIHSDIEKALVPCIIKFKADTERDFGIRPAIYYVYKCINEEPVSQGSNTCFDAKGKVIPLGDIIKIEYIEMP